MNTLSGIKISHKISSLMIGLIAGFMIVGVAYYAQVTTDLKVEKNRADHNQAYTALTQLAEAQAVYVRSAMESLDPAQPVAATEELRQAVDARTAALGQVQYQFQSPAELQQLRTAQDAFHQEWLQAREQPVSQPQISGGMTDSVESGDTLAPEVAATEPQVSPLATAQAQLETSAQALAAKAERYGQWLDDNLTRRLDAAASEKFAAQLLFAAALFLTAAGTTLGLFLIYRSIVLPLWHMQGIIAQQNRGNDKARVKIMANDELGELGLAFNRLLDERIQTLREQSAENEQLNNSIIGLIRALGTIAKKDLSIKVPVSADVTGTISDAVNLLTSETARTLHQVRGYSEKVNTISDQLQQQSSHLVSVGQAERNEVGETLAALEQAARAMTHIAREARIANSIAAATIDNTLKAQSAVGQTLDGIQTIRGTLSETEKRIKRLGDRSQEITGIVNLINTIAERTHILALNASMHAASAGEAGKGFAVVAEEVQRLAENARGATSEIATMVNNIRVETSDAVNVLNKLITQVAEGTRLAEDSGQRMQDTETATRQLVNHVKSIAVNSVNQSRVSNQLHKRAQRINDTTEKTCQALEAQHQQTDELKDCARSLMDRVMIFTLPEFRESERAEQKVPQAIHQHATDNAMPFPLVQLATERVANG